MRGFSMYRDSKKEEFWDCIKIKSTQVIGKEITRSLEHVFEKL